MSGPWTRYEPNTGSELQRTYTGELRIYPAHGTMTVPMDIDGHNVNDQTAAILDSSADKASYIAATRTLADQSREDLTVREALGQPNVLQALFGRLQSISENNYDVDYEQETLRCIGNACAMNQDAIRTISSLGFAWFQRYTEQSCPQKLQNLASAVLFNISAADFSADGDDQEQENPALKACFEAGIHVWLIRVLVNPGSNSLGLEDLIDMLFWISSNTNADTASQLPSDTISQLVNSMQHYCTGLSAEALSTLIESIVALLRSAKAQLAARSDTIGLFSLLQSLEDRIKMVRQHKQESEAAEVAVLLPQASNLTWLLSDVSAEPTFAVARGLDDPLVASCLTTVQARNAGEQSEQLTIASCLVLGNALLNISEHETVKLINTTQLLSAVVDILSQVRASPDLVHAAAGLLTVLCRAKETRETICDSDSVVSIVERLCRHSVPQMREAGVRLLKALGRDSARNQERLAAVVQAYGSTQPTPQQIDAAP